MKRNYYSFLNMNGGCSKSFVLFFYKPSSPHRVPGLISWRAKGLHTYLIMSRPNMKVEKPGCENPKFSWRAKGPRKARREIDFREKEFRIASKLISFQRYR